MKKISVIGSINMDIVNSVENFPLPGETVVGLETSYHPGGKGANQAVAAARSGASVMMIGAIGTDLYGKALEASLQSHGIDHSHVCVKEGGSGIAFILVNRKGENQIILSSGANGKLRPEDIPDEIVSESDLILLQNEIPQHTNAHVLQESYRHNVPVIVNPAPAIRIPKDTLRLIHTIVLNETEAEVVTGMKVSDLNEAESAGRSLQTIGVRNVLITMGRKGALYLSGNSKNYCRAFKVQAADTTAAGDTFIGAFAAASLSGSSIEYRLRFASAAAAIAVTRKGAQESIPAYEEILEFLKSDLQ